MEESRRSQGQARTSCIEPRGDSLGRAQGQAGTSFLVHGSAQEQAGRGLHEEHEGGASWESPGTSRKRPPLKSVGASLVGEPGNEQEEASMKSVGASLVGEPRNEQEGASLKSMGASLVGEPGNRWEGAPWRCVLA